MIVVGTDAPIDTRNLHRLAARTMMGLGRTGSAASNGSGDFAIAFSTNRQPAKLLSNDDMSPLFLAAIEATEEAIYNSLFKAKTTTGRGRTVELEVTRRYTISPSEGKNTDPYQLRHETTFRNLGANPRAAFRVSLALGTAPPAHARDDGLQITTGYASDGKFIFVQRSDLDAAGGFLGMGARTARYSIESPGPVTWASVKNKFFTSILTPDQPASGMVSAVASPDAAPRERASRGKSKSSSAVRSPLSATAISIAFSNSRTFPGQE